MGSNTLEKQQRSERGACVVGGRVHRACVVHHQAACLALHRLPRLLIGRKGRICNRRSKLLAGAIAVSTVVRVERTFV
jgi:hypothetical protein